MINNKGTEISKGNEAIIALSRNIKAEVNFKAERAFIFNINKTERRIKILRKRLNRIISNSLLKEAKDDIILKKRK